MNVDRIFTGRCYLYRPGRRRHPQLVRAIAVHRAAGRVSVVALPGRRIITVAADLLQPAAVSLPEPVAEGEQPDER